MEQTHGFEKMLSHETETETQTAPALLCPKCGGELKYYCSVLPFQMIPPGKGNSVNLN